MPSVDSCKGCDYIARQILAVNPPCRSLATVAMWPAVDVANPGAWSHRDQRSPSVRLRRISPCGTLTRREVAGPTIAPLVPPWLVRTAGHRCNVPLRITAAGRSGEYCRVNHNSYAGGIETNFRTRTGRHVPTWLAHYILRGRICAPPPPPLTADMWETIPWRIAAQNAHSGRRRDRPPALTAIWSARACPHGRAWPALCHQRRGKDADCRAAV
jgi:hypothetical protein